MKKVVEEKALIFEEPNPSTLNHGEIPLRTSYNFPHYFYIPLNLLYYLCLSPFKVSKTCDHVELGQQPIQKALCFVNHLILGAASVPFVCSAFQDSLRQNPGSLFIMFNSVVWTCHLYILIYQSWFQRKDILELLNINRRPKTWKVYGAWLLLLATLALHLLPSLFMVHLNDHLNWYERLQDNLFYSGRHNTAGLGLNVSLLNIHQVSTVSLILAETCVLYSLLYDIIGYTCFTQFMIAAWGIHEIACELKPQGAESVQSIQNELLKYCEAKKCIHLINTVFGGTVLLRCVTTISFTSMKFVTVVEGEDGVYSLMIFLFLGMSLIWICISAEAHAKMKGFEDNLRRYRVYEGGTWYPASVFIDSIPGHISLAGGSFFTLTYSFLGQAMTVFLTYVIIIVQFEAGNN